MSTSWKPIRDEHTLLVVSCLTQKPFNEEQCHYCARYGCTDRGFTVTAGDPPRVLGEAEFAQQMDEKLTQVIEAHQSEYPFHLVRFHGEQCVRKTKMPEVKRLLGMIQTCNADCHRNRDAVTGALWKDRGADYHCPYRNERSICLRNVAIDNMPLVCFPDKKNGCTDCGYHEFAYEKCPYRKDQEPCYEVREKLGVPREKWDHVLMLSHRFNAAPCLYHKEGECRNEQSTHFEGGCTLHGMMAPCEDYAPTDRWYSEGVYTVVSSADGKNDRAVFHDSDYANDLDTIPYETLCFACRISHRIAKVTGLKCLGVRREAKNPFLNEDNPLHDQAVQINYLYLTNPEDVAKYQPDLIAQAIYDALTLNCQGLECVQFETCKLRRK